MELTDRNGATGDRPTAGNHQPGRIAGVLVFVAIVLTAGAFAPGVAADYFFSDAYTYIAQNEPLRAIPLYEFWRVVETPLFWRELLPLRDLVYRVEMAAFGVEPIPYKAVNLVLLLLCGLAVWAFANDFMRRFGGHRNVSAAPLLAATVTMVLWVAHPSHVESVAWAAGLKDVLSGLFGLGALYCFQRALPLPGEARRVRAAPLAAATLLFAAALMSKVTVAPVAGMALLLSLAALYRPRQSWPSLARGLLVSLPLLAIAAAFVGGHVVLADAGARPDWFAAVGDGRFARAVRILGTMYQVALVPYDLRLVWNVYEGGVLGAIRFVFAALAVLGAVWGAWAFIVRRVPEGFGLAAAFGATVPLLHLIPFETWSLVSERHLFWTLFGLALAAGTLAARTVARGKARSGAAVLAVGVAGLACLGLSAHRSLEWFAGQEHLRAIENEADPASGFGAVMRIEDELRAGRFDVAKNIASRVENEAQRNMLRGLVETVDAVMQLARNRDSRAALLRADRKMLEAEAAARAVRDSASDPASVWLAYTMRSKLIRPYEILIRLAPGQPAFRYNLALIKKDGLGPLMQSEAEQLFLQVVSSQRLPPPAKANAWIHIANIRQRRNDPAGARQALWFAMASDPNGYDAAYHLARLEAEGGDREAAAKAGRQYRSRAGAAGVDPAEIAAKLNDIGLAQGRTPD